MRSSTTSTPNSISWPTDPCSAAAGKNWLQRYGAFRSGGMFFYEVIPDGIAIVRVLHGARDLGPLFEDE
jgi:hypothetical protein